MEKGFTSSVGEFWIGWCTRCRTRPMCQSGLDERRCWPSMLVQAKEWMNFRLHQAVQSRRMPRVVFLRCLNQKGLANWRSWALQIFFSCFPWRCLVFLSWWRRRRGIVPRCMSRVQFPRCQGNRLNAPRTWQLSCLLRCHRWWAQWSLFLTRGSWRTVWADLVGWGAR